MLIWRGSNSVSQGLLCRGGGRIFTCHRARQELCHGLLFFSCAQFNLGDVVASQRSLKKAVDFPEYRGLVERLQILATNYLATQ